MIINLLYWASISLISFGWGNIFISLAFKKALGKSVDIELPFVFLIGLSIIGSIALYLSLFIPLNWKASFIIAVPALVYYFLKENRRRARIQFSLFFQDMSWLSYLILSVCIFMVLVIASAKITHPDTLAYHVQSILWMKTYKAVPGIAHLKLELGFQSIWFAIQAILSPGFKNTNALFFTNGCILVWYFIFFINKINPSLKRSEINKPEAKANWTWLLLLIYSCLSWTQVRLTAASASPDFIVAIYIWSSVYFILRYSSSSSYDDSYLLIPVLFCSTALATKLSAIPVLILILIISIHLIKYKRNITFLLLCCIFILTLTPILIRNYISSGYPLYPSSIAGFLNPDWKLDENTLERFRHYITTYARYPVYNIQSQLQLEVPISKWLPYWWWNLNLADKVLISTIVMSIVYNLFFLRRFITITKKHFFVFLAILVGCIFWFIKAPGPRFGTGYLICLVYFLLTPIFSTTNPAQGVKSILPFKLAIAIFLIAITGYCNYRLVKFFQPSEIIFPAGIEKVEYQPYNYMNLQMNYVDKNTNVCGATPVPCITDSINNFVPRGNTVEEGFKSKPTQ